MDVITENYNNISITQLEHKLSQKFAELRKIEQKESIEGIKQKDYFEEPNSIGKNYDEQDFQRVLNKFKQSDINIRSHEQIHASIGHTTAPISYTYQEGPDGKMYAIGGHVRLDTSIPNDPKAAEFKLDQLKRASTAPSDVSGADMNIATQANLNKILLNIQGGNDAS
ncbi:MAG: putative metalloprotease CJM1_0395 family protein [Campylobacterota bacterium]|nr:putative metalloprotease CJM1_0395 family protein [Campylobacterota bacterium]